MVIDDNIQRVESYPDLRKVEGSYIINNNDKEYDIARARKNTKNALSELEQRVNMLDSKITTLIDLLTNFTKIGK